MRAPSASRTQPPKASLIDVYDNRLYPGPISDLRAQLLASLIDVYDNRLYPGPISDLRAQLLASGRMT